MNAQDVQRLVAEMSPQQQQAMGGSGAQSHVPRVGPFASSMPYGSQPYGYGAGLYGSLGGRSSLGGGGQGNGLRTLGLPASPFAFGPNAAARTLPPNFNAMGGSGSAAMPPPPPAPDASAVALAQAYQTRMAALSSVAASLLGKRESIVHQLAKVQTRMGEVTSAREAIEAETFADAEAILHRLRAAEASKMAVLQHDADTLVTDVAAIDGFYSALTSFQPNSAAGAASLLGTASTAQQQGMGAVDAGALYDPHVALDFMRAYPELCAEADRLVGKAVKTEVDVRADDLDRETASRNDLATKYTALVDLVAAKDRIILQLLKERESVMRDRDLSRSAMESAMERVATGRETFEKEKAAEVDNWAR